MDSRSDLCSVGFGFVRLTVEKSVLLQSILCSRFVLFLLLLILVDFWLKSVLFLVVLIIP